MPRTYEISVQLRYNTKHQFQKLQPMRMKNMKNVDENIKKETKLKNIETGESE